MDLKEKALNDLYESMAKSGLINLELHGDAFMPVIFVIGADFKMYVIPIERDKEKVAQIILAVTKRSNAIGVLTLAEAWSVRRKELDPHTVISEEPDREEIFLATLETRFVNKMRVWKIKRDPEGKRIFPLEEDTEVTKDFSGITWHQEMAYG